ncbi:MAG: hypothetical protein ACYS67_16305 [Planctomycetota bacterium]|jgi:hypothetical protein
MKIQTKINNHLSLIIWLEALYTCRETITDVMSALQIAPFLTNKANFLGDQMNVSDCFTNNYEPLTMNYEIKNKPKTNPIQSQFKPNTKPIQTQYEPNSNPNKANSDPKTPPSVINPVGAVL